MELQRSRRPVLALLATHLRVSLHRLPPAVALLVATLIVQSQWPAFAEGQPGQRCGGLDSCRAACDTGKKKACERVRRLSKIQQECDQGVDKACEELAKLGNPGAAADACPNGDERACRAAKKKQGGPDKAKVKRVGAACDSGDGACRERQLKRRGAEFNCRQGVAKACQQLGKSRKTGARARQWRGQ